MRSRGAERIRTAVRGFAGLCLTTRPPRPARRNRIDVGCQGTLQLPAESAVGAPATALVQMDEPSKVSTNPIRSLAIKRALP